MKFTCTLNNADMNCTIVADRDIETPVLCFSCLAPTHAASGGQWVSSTGGFTEVQLPNLIAHQPHEITLRYSNAEFHPANRAWLPLGAYLRTPDGPIELPALPAGVHSSPAITPTPLEGLLLVPQPTGWTPTGQTVAATGFSGQCDALAEVEKLAERQQIKPFLTDDGHPIECITEDMPTDAYRLEIGAEKICLFAASYGGQFYGAISLLSLLKTHAGVLPCGTITDSPRFGWRGQHLDCARHFYRPDTIHELLDLMALMKLNRFHWHFADDEAFRLEVDCLPALWQKTAFRGEGELVPGVFGGGIRSGGSYSKADVAALLAHAAHLNIEIMPEIEVPAHALAFARVFPETRDPNDTGTEESVQGYTNNVLNPAMPRTWEVLEALATEVAALFPFGHLHLGCDELPEDTWMGSPAAKSLMEKHNLETTNDLLGWTIERLAARVSSQGIRPAAWEEAAQGKNGGIANDAILFSWTGQGAGIAAARAGYDVVMTPAQHVYMDMAHTDDPDDWGANWAAYIALGDTIAWDPVPADAPDIADKIIGVQGCFWSEFTTDDRELMPMLMPRILGVAVKAWQPDASMNTDDLHALATHYSRLLG